MNFDELKATLRAFADERDWDQFHSPKNLSMALSVEVAELLEHFQWRTEAESHALPPETAEQVAEEMADIWAEPEAPRPRGSVPACAVPRTA
jgi:dCTP diphosphatase